MEKIKTKKLRNALVCFLIFFALLCGIEFLPIIAQILPFVLILAPAIVLAIPLVLVYVLVSSGYNYGAVVGIVGFAIAALLGFSTTWYMAAAFIPVTAAASYMIVKAKRFRTSIAISSFATLAGVAIVIGILMLATKMSVIDYVMKIYGEQLSALGDAEITFIYGYTRYADLINGAVTQEAINATAAADAIAKMQEAAREMLNLSIVNMMIVYSMVVGFFAYIAPRAMAKKAGQSVADIPKFKDYMLPKRFWLVAVVTILAAVAGSSFDWRGFDILQVTLYSVYVFVFMIQGVSLLVYWLDARKTSKGKKTIFIIIAVMFLQAAVLPIAGLLENMMGIRARMEARKADKS